MLVNCVAYQEGKKLADIEQSQIREYLARPGCFVWVALRDASDAELDSLSKEFDVPELALEDARHGHQRAKIEEYGAELFVVMQLIEHAGDELKVGEISIFTGPNYVFSVRNRTEQSFLGVRSRCEREPELLRQGPGYVLYALMDAVVDRYFYVKQKLTTLKHAAGPLLEATGKLYGGRVPQICAGLGDYFRDVYDHLVRLNQTIDSMRDTVNTAIQVNLAMITIGESEVTKRLAAYAALVAVPTMIAGVYGMNFKEMPELSWTWGYPFALFLMVSIDFVLFWRFRRAGWL